MVLVRMKDNDKVTLKDIVIYLMILSVVLIMMSIYDYMKKHVSKVIKRNTEPAEDNHKSISS